jgi:hypothetical protein
MWTPPPWTPSGLPLRVYAWLARMYIHIEALGLDSKGKLDNRKTLGKDRKKSKAFRPWRPFSQPAQARATTLTWANTGPLPLLAASPYCWAGPIAQQRPTT